MRERFGYGVESYAGTNPSIACGLDAWPADIDNGGFSDTADLLALTAHFSAPIGQPPNPPARYDFAPNRPNGFVDTADISMMTRVFSESC